MNYQCCIAHRDDISDGHAREMLIFPNTDNLHHQLMVLVQMSQIPSQHTGDPAKPVIRVSDKVKSGQMIGKIPEGKLGAAVHSSIDGKIIKITDESIYIEAL